MASADTVSAVVRLPEASLRSCGEHSPKLEVQRHDKNGVHALSFRLTRMGKCCFLCLSARSPRIAWRRRLAMGLFS